MNSAYVYLQLYKLFNNSTPIKADCGKLCNAACCKGEDGGMYLFPGEKRVFELLTPDWIRLEKSDFTYEYNGKKKSVYIAFCNESCDRFERPLACRIFPLTPILDDDGKLDIIIDPRSKAICPMGAAFKLDDFDAGFIKNVKKTFITLSKNKEFAEFLKAYTEYLKDFQKFI